MDKKIICLAYLNLDRLFVYVSDTLHANTPDLTRCPVYYLVLDNTYDKVNLKFLLFSFPGKFKRGKFTFFRCLS